MILTSPILPNANSKPGRKEILKSLKEDALKIKGSGTVDTSNEKISSNAPQYKLNKRV